MHINRDQVDAQDITYGELLDVQQGQLAALRPTLDPLLYDLLVRWVNTANRPGTSTSYHIVPRGDDLKHFISNYSK